MHAAKYSSVIINGFLLSNILVYVIAGLFPNSFPKRKAIILLLIKHKQYHLHNQNLSLRIIIASICKVLLESLASIYSYVQA